MVGYGEGVDRKRKIILKCYMKNLGNGPRAMEMGKAWLIYEALIYYYCNFNINYFNFDFNSNFNCNFHFYFYFNFNSLFIFTSFILIYDSSLHDHS